ncbi:hypothetical protein ABW286_21905 [Erwinia papayae]|uniref:Phage protein n=1 Tax=Erwinia papayae TaxID=206499 RepID=A0ABV3N7J1_9GAMM
MQTITTREQLLVNGTVCEKLAEGELPVTCHTCHVIWHDVHQFEASDFDTESEKASFVDTGLTEITIDEYSKPEEE